MKEKQLKIKLLKEIYGVCRLSKDDVIPSWGMIGEFFSITRTGDELSIVCLQENIPSNIKCENDWRVLKVEGPLDFSLVGILSKISGIMAENNISIFAISTYDTDYILVKGKDIERAIRVLSDDSYEFVK